MLTNRKRLLDPKVNVRDASLFVIATEGEETEKQYFEMFDHPRLIVRVLPTSEDHKSAPRHVLSRLDKFREVHALWETDTLWLMIDVDHHRAKELKAVCLEAEQKGFLLAISNPCFELWLLLHHDMEAVGADLKCMDIESRLRQLTGSYNKTRIEVDRFRDRVMNAIDHARSLDVEPAGRWPIAPGTHVYKLVESLGQIAPLFGR